MLNLNAKRKSFRLLEHIDEYSMEEKSANLALSNLSNKRIVEKGRR